MLPRYMNPHLLHISAKKTSREEIAFHDGIDPSEEETSADIDERLLLLNKLHERLQDSLDFVADSRKRRKISESQSVVVSTEPILFKLISREEKLINIEAGPPKPPPHYREPAYEDSEKFATRRRERSEAVAVDFTWVMHESRKTQLPFPSWSSRVIDATAVEPFQTGLPLVILQHLQPPRKTRPRVPAELLAHHPYTVGALPHPDAQRKPQKEVPLVEVMLQSSELDAPTQKQRRKRMRRHRKSKP